MAIERVTFNIFVTKEPLVEKYRCNIQEVVDLLKEDDFKDNIMEFEGSKKVKKILLLKETTWVPFDPPLV